MIGSLFGEIFHSENIIRVLRILLISMMHQYSTLFKRDIRLPKMSFRTRRIRHLYILFYDVFSFSHNFVCHNFCYVNFKTMYFRYYFYVSFSILLKR